MIKFGESAFDNELDILNFSHYKGGCLNKQTIILLLSLGIKEGIFWEIYQENLKKIRQQDFGCNSKQNKKRKSKLVDDEDDDDENDDEVGSLFNFTQKLHKEFINNGLPFSNEPFLAGMMNAMSKAPYYQLKDKINLRVDKSVRVMGVMDEYGILEPDEIYLAISKSDMIEGKDRKVIDSKKVIVTRNPCLHPGDIRILQARNDKICNKNFQNITNCVVFSQKGTRSQPSMMAGGDLDGDEYFVSWDPRLIPKKAELPMEYDEKYIKQKSKGKEK